MDTVEYKPTIADQLFHKAWAQAKKSRSYRASVWRDLEKQISDMKRDLEAFKEKLFPSPRLMNENSYVDMFT